jgi:hypothetical protein
MLSNDAAVSNVFAAVVPGLNGAIADLMTVGFVLIGFSLIILAYFSVRSLLNLSIVDGEVIIEKRDYDEEEFLKDKQEFEWLSNNDKASDEFIRKVGEVKKQRLVRKWGNR